MHTTPASPDPRPLPEQLGFATRYFDLPGLRLHAAVAGPAHGPLVVLLHGFPEFWYSWRHQLRALASAGFRVVAPDQRGYNLTDKTPPYDLLTLVADIAALIQACGGGPAYVAGHDWGAAVAWGLAGAHPELVHRLAILNVPHPLAMQRALLGGNWDQVRRSWYMGFFQIPALPEWSLLRQDCAALRRMLRASARPGTFSGEDLARLAQAWRRPGALRASLGWYRALPGQTRRALDRLPGLRRILPPTLMLWGEQDAALSVQVAEASLAYLAEGRLVRFPQATHWVHQDLPAEISQHLQAHFTPGE